MYTTYKSLYYKSLRFQFNVKIVVVFYEYMIDKHTGYISNLNNIMNDSLSCKK